MQHTTNYLSYLIMKQIILSIVFLSMSITGWGQLFVTLPVNFDSPIVYHDNYNSENQNYGNTAFLSAFQIPGNQGGVNTSRGLIAFDLSSIPIGSTILSAKLNLYAYTDFTIVPLQDGHYGNNQSVLSRIITNWNEATVTWNTQPSVSNLHETLVNQSTNPQQDYLNINVAWEVNLPQMFLKQRNQKRLPCVCVNKQKIHPIAMARILAYK